MNPYEDAQKYISSSVVADLLMYKLMYELVYELVYELHRESAQPRPLDAGAADSGGHHGWRGRRTGLKKTSPGVDLVVDTGACF